MPSSDYLRVNLRLRSGHYRWTLRLIGWSIWAARYSRVLAVLLSKASTLIARRGLEVVR